jgi:4'-phosphopantetheinyl transferase
MNQDLIRVWKVPFDLPEELVDRFSRYLSAEDLRQSSRFHFNEDRRRFKISRGTLRGILAPLVHLRPCDLTFGRGKLGKPFLVDPPGARKLQFSVSHSLDLALIAVLEDCAVGVDVEKVREITSFRAIARNFFSKKEREWISSGKNANEQIRNFLKVWTRREAVAKAQGLGLRAALSLGYQAQSNRVSLLSDMLKSQVETSGLERKGWFLQDLEIDSSHQAALCAEGPRRDIVVLDFLQGLC